MPLFALDEHNAVVFSSTASPKGLFRCRECGSALHLRRGRHRQPHFYHLHKTSNCQLTGKSATHMAVQAALQRRIGAEELQLEVRFPEIGRIADSVWSKEKIIFEVQYSPISSEELLARNEDYASLGLRVIWIFHDKRYNRRKLSEAELACQGTAYYFTNIDERGKGIFYDQFELIDGAVRKGRVGPLPVSFERGGINANFPEEAPASLNNRHSSGAHFLGDSIFLWRGESQRSELFRKRFIGLLERQSNPVDSTESIWKRLWKRYFLRSYMFFFQIAIERATR